MFSKGDVALIKGTDTKVEVIGEPLHTAAIAGQPTQYKCAVHVGSETTITRVFNEDQLERIDVE